MKARFGFLDVFSVGVFAFLYLPLLCVVMFSVNASRLGLQWGGFTLHWYADLFRDELIQRAALNTLFLAVVSTVISTVLGTCLALGIQRHHWPKRTGKMLEILLNIPIVTPDIIFAVALVIAFSALRLVSSLFELGMPTMIIGHVAFQISFVALVIRGRLQMIGQDLEEAAFDLYAEYPRMLWTVVIPLLKPAILAGAALAFTLSLDDFVISFFTAGPKSITLPIYIYAAVHRGVTPEIHALSTLVMLMTIAAVTLMQWMTRHSDKEIKA
ncbi:MAG TPA: ABC transporter permease [Fibrobacteraceae bacterium]|nr:ABC transporter permease [Fibrobacteraceae bacterium]